MFSIRFDLPSGETLWALTDEGGWADTPEYAMKMASADRLAAVLEKSYRHSAQYAVIVTTEEVTA